MCERHAVPPHIIERSRELRGTDATRMENLIVDLERRAQDLSRSRADATGEKDRLDKLVQTYETKVASLEKDLRQIKSRAIEEAEEIVRRANAVIEKSVKEIRENSAAREVVRKVREEVRSISKEFSSIKDEIEKREELEFGVGDSVLIKNTGAVGEIEAMLDPEHYLVIMGGIRARVNRRDLAPAAQKPAQPRGKEFEISKT